MEEKNKIQELKAQAYDVLIQIEFYQRELKKINTLILEENKKSKLQNKSEDK